MLPGRDRHGSTTSRPRPIPPGRDPRLQAKISMAPPPPSPFRASTENPREKKGKEKKREKKSDEMRGKEKNKFHILGGPTVQKCFFNRIQSVYKVYSEKLLYTL
jgi:hypothetical protein